MALKIEQIKSPNFSLRKSPFINVLVIHATGSGNIEGTISWFKQTKSGVSSHYLVGKDGRTICFVDTANKAWHAGVSSWEGKTDVGSFSVGIELVNKNDGKDPYPPEQIKALAELTVLIQKAHPGIKDEGIVGHDQVAPGRKSDPNLNFPWVAYGVALERARHANA